ncbi:hypothetical protein GGH95_002734 [Coemansia sp. RSA 1836]|nr:hypothetical protein GGH95_002734 [Coemansia sp. RSA 1836]
MVDNGEQQARIASVLATKADLVRAMDAYVQRLHSSSQTAATSYTATERRAEQESWRLPTDPVRLVKSPKNAKPSYHVMVNDQQQLPPTLFDSKALKLVNRFIARLEQQHPELMTTPVKLKQPWIPDGHTEQRIVAFENTINHYFVAEVAPVIKAILNSSRPEARFEVIEGSPNSHADLFLHVRIKNADGLWVFSSVAVELKRPYGANHEKSAIASRKKWPRWMRDADMPNDKVAEHVLRQIFEYMQGSDDGAPEYVRGSIAPHVGLISNYNSTWIVSIRSVADTASRSAPPTERLYVSSRFSLDSTETPIAFVYAYVLDGIIADMKASKSGYKEEKDLDNSE